MITSLLVSMFLLAAPPASQPATSPVNAEMRRVIDDFLKSPQKDERAGRIVQFAAQSDSISIVLNQDVLTWMNHQPKYEQADLLLVVFIAGNARSQLASGRNSDDTYAGLKEVFRVYRDMQQNQSDLKITEIEDLIDKDKGGALEAFIAGKMSDRSTPPATRPANR
jgi:hypothetical protein